MRARAYSVPENIGVAGLAAAGVAVLFPLVHRLTGLGLPPCLLRTFTGIPCPLCGMTTAMLALVKGDVAAAGSANPFGFAIAALAASGLFVLLARKVGIMPGPVPWSPAARRLCGIVVAGLATVSWIYQLHRLGFF